MPRIAIAVLAVIFAACGRRTIRDHLTNPIGIVSTTGDRLVLADGTARDVPGINALVVVCPSIDSVEVKPDGTLFCILPVFHWCGNDPIGEHFEKVPPERFIAFIRDDNPRGGISTCFDRGGRLDVSVFVAFLRATGVDWDRDAEIVFPGE